jgi:DNA mismatch repair ATPase MutL
MLVLCMSCKKFRVLIVAINLFLVHFANSLHATRGRVSHQRFKTKHLYSQLLVPQHLDLSQQIFCNVELNGENLEAVGFDMDFTLAQVRCKPGATAF